MALLKFANESSLKEIRDLKGIGCWPYWMNNLLHRLDLSDARNQR